ncbi:hypothetical protein SS05631_d64760 (plasmid) [Sinorhizobium sp. CCBAU 05631]|nr:hypothetical protein SS05631_d64760 [Sinorhizobium sp. CCBAU 05631]
MKTTGCKVSRSTNEISLPRTLTKSPASKRGFADLHVK